MTTQHTPLLILGSGPAGYTAGIYASRAALSPVLITGIQTGGQLTTTSEIENFPGFPDKITGQELMERMQQQSVNVGTKLVFDTAVKVDLLNSPFTCTLDSGDIWTCDALIIATGASARWLDLPNEESLKGFGVSACATCDGFFYRNKKVAVIGGGNAAVEEALYLSKLASHVTLIHRRDTLRAEKIMQERVLNNPKITVLWNTAPTAFIGTPDAKGLTGLALKNVHTNALSELSVDGAFVAIGYAPNTDIFKDQLALNDQGFIDSKDGIHTNISGVFVAGDVQEMHHRQAITAAAGGCRSALEAQRYLER